MSVSYCTKRCISIKIEQFVAAFPRREKAMFKVVNHTVELILLSADVFIPVWHPLQRQQSSPYFMHYLSVSSYIKVFRSKTFGGFW